MLSLLKLSALSCILSFIYSTVSAQHCSDLLARHENKKEGYIGFQTTSLNQPVEVSKSIVKGNTSYLLRLEVLGKSKLPDNFLLTLKLENGAKIEKNQQELASHITEANVQNDPGKVYMVFVKLSQNELELLAANRMTNYKLHRFAVSFKPENQDIFQESIQCLIAAK
ncbi:hypothetical protein LX87_02155 [Larkinella arboricola]|uniref:Uncharacterized protein n=1 Tax=Larkinella arboricola TaxID=643671 RepID=A0A327X5R8_LARAB|nr:hypothetical protein [Larkinella arboricola]RAK00453.1 hypothetical protein LX87_02155 [Larkinella arboricola]